VQRGCDLLILLSPFIDQQQNQKIAAFGSSYKITSPAQGALEKQYRLSLLQVFAMRQ